MTSRTVPLCDGTVDLATHLVVRDGRAGSLTTLEARLLDYLVENAGRDVPRAELQERVWGYGPKVQTRAMDHTLARLRSKIEADPRSPRHLVTVHGIGYRFVHAEPTGGQPSIHPAPLLAALPTADRAPEPLEALGPEERAALATLSVFRDGFTAEAAARVLPPPAPSPALPSPLSPAPPPAPPMLDHLRELALVETTVTRGAARFHLAPGVASWAAAALEPAARALAERAHAAHFLDETFAGDDNDLGHLADEHENLRAVHERFSSSDPPLAVRAILTLDPLYYARGPGHQHIELLSQAAISAEGGTLLGAVLLARAEAWGAVGDIDAAEEDVNGALHAAAERPDLVARALIARGNVRRRQARFDEAYALYERALTLSGKDEPRSLALRQLAGCDIEANRFSLALQRFRELEQRHRADGNTRGVAAVLGAMGNIHSELGELARAERCFLGAMDLSVRVLDRRREGIALSNLAVVLHERGQLDEARAAWERSLAMHREVVNRRFEGFAAGGLGVLAHETGRRDEARLLATEALAIFREVGDKRFETIGRARLAVLAATGPQIRDDLAAIGPVGDADTSALHVLAGFADLADAHAARERGDEPAAAEALTRARAACAFTPTTRPTSFHRISVRILTAWLARWPPA